MEKKVKILFMHNGIPDYRIPWFKEMNNIIDIKYVFTNQKVILKTYGTKIDNSKISNLDYVIFGNIIDKIKQLKIIKSNISKYDFVELPPVDSLNELLISKYIVKQCKKNSVKIGYFWEKWEAPLDKQPLKRKIKNKLLGTAAKFIYKDADIIFAGGTKSKEYFIKNGINSKNIKILPDCSETSKPKKHIDIRRKYNIEQDKKIILYFGRAIREKGLDYLIRAFSQVKNKKNMFLLVAGDGEFLQQCKIIAKNLNIENIKFVGKVHPDNRELFFAQCDIFVFPGTFYGGWVDVWGLTINEAIQHGKIVISTNAVGSAIDLIKNNENGFLVEAENEKALKEALDKSIDESLADRAKAKDKEIVKKYCYKQMAKVYCDEVKKII